MIDRDRASAIAQEWLDAWNAHDPERVVAHFAKNVIVVSPLLEQLRPKSKGVIDGKREVLEYYRDGLAAAGDLHFELVEVCTSVTEVVIVYRNHRGTLVTESLEFDGDEVIIVRVAYGA
jgi:ketosteroid isomerase-like protein